MSSESGGSTGQGGGATGEGMECQSELSEVEWNRFVFSTAADGKMKP